MQRTGCSLRSHLFHGSKTTIAELELHFVRLAVVATSPEPSSHQSYPKDQHRTCVPSSPWLYVVATCALVSLLDRIEWLPRCCRGYRERRCHPQATVIFGTPVHTLSSSSPVRTLSSSSALTLSIPGDQEILCRTGIRHMLR